MRAFVDPTADINSHFSRRVCEPKRLSKRYLRNSIVTQPFIQVVRMCLNPAPL